MRSVIIAMFMQICATAPLLAEVDFPEQILFADSAYEELTRFASEFGDYGLPAGTSMAQAYEQTVGIEIAEEAMYSALFAISNCKATFTIAHEVLKVPSRSWNDAEDFADSLSSSRALHIFLFAFRQFGVNCWILNRAVERLQKAIPLMTNVALVSTARDALQVMRRTRDRLDQYDLKEPSDSLGKKSIPDGVEP